MKNFYRFTVLSAKAICIFWLASLLPVLGYFLSVSFLGKYDALSKEFVAFGFIRLTREHAYLYTIAVLCTAVVFVFSMFFIESEKKQREAIDLENEYEDWLYNNGLQTQSREEDAELFRRFYTSRFLPDQTRAERKRKAEIAVGAAVVLLSLVFLCILIPTVRAYNTEDSWFIYAFSVFAALGLIYMGSSLIRKNLRKDGKK